MSALMRPVNIFDILEEVIDQFMEVAGPIIVVVALIATLLWLLVTAIVGITSWLLSAFAVYKLAKKMNYKYAFLAWIPFFGDLFHQHVLCFITNGRPLQFLSGVTPLKNRKVSFGIFFGGYVINSTINFLSQSSGNAGFVVKMLLLPVAVPVRIMMDLLRIAYLRDVLDCFREDKKSNHITAIVIVILDKLVTKGIARGIYLCTLINQEPIWRPGETE